MPSDSLRFTLLVLSQMKDLIKLNKPGKFPKGSIRSSHFRDRQKLV